MSQNPQCFHNHRFLFDFFIEHVDDHDISLVNKRYWLEYHKLNSNVELHSKYHLITPTALSHQVANSKSLVPYREWLHINDTKTFLHGPFNFAKVNNRKTWYHINITDWDIL